jgi:thiamine pyrophosphokinase
MNNRQFSKTVVLGNGAFPNHHIPLHILNSAETIICCDGAADNLINYGKIPSVIVGDMDSISSRNKLKFQNIIVHIPDQDTNDQTKAVQWAIKNGYSDLVILGNTGKREDHTIANISLLCDYEKLLKICAVSDTGIFTPISGSKDFNSFCGEQVSIFSLKRETRISSRNLKYHMVNLALDSWWQGTLNESLGNEFSVYFEIGDLIVFQAFS